MYPRWHIILLSVDRFVMENPNVFLLLVNKKIKNVGHMITVQTTTRKKTLNVIVIQNYIRFYRKQISRLFYLFFPLNNISVTYRCVIYFCFSLLLTFDSVQVIEASIMIVYTLIIWIKINKIISTQRPQKHSRYTYLNTI